MSDVKYTITIPMNLHSDVLKGMDFYKMFQLYFCKVYDLEMRVNPCEGDTSELIFKGEETAIQAVCQVLQEMGLKMVSIEDPDPDVFH